jgi:hypothetical protein
MRDLLCTRWVSALTYAAAWLLAIFAWPASAQAAASGPQATPQPAPSYALTARLYLQAPIVLRATVQKPGLFERNRRQKLADGRWRILFDADLQTVYKAPVSVRTPVTVAWEGPATPAGQAPDFSRQSVILFLRPRAAVGKSEGAAFETLEAQALTPWTPAAEAMVRAIGSETQAPGLADLGLTGIMELFEQDGDPPFQRGYQFFIGTRSGGQVSVALNLNDNRRGADQVFLATGDTMGDGQVVKRDTLPWYLLACTLPKPSAAQLREASRLSTPADASRAFNQLTAALGPCS